MALDRLELTMTYTMMSEVPIPKSEELDLDRFCPMETSFDAMMKERQELKAAAKVQEARLAELDALIGGALDLAGQKTIIWNEHIVSRREGSKPRQTLDRILLLEAGVTPEQIQRSIKLGKPGKGGIAVRHLAEKQEENNWGDPN